eukprot:889650-Pleurochrysis_carterae.AAC.1
MTSEQETNEMQPARHKAAKATKAKTWHSKESSFAEAGRQRRSISKRHERAHGGPTSQMTAMECLKEADRGPKLALRHPRSVRGLRAQKSTWKGRQAAQERWRTSTGRSTYKQLEGNAVSRLHSVGKCLKNDEEATGLRKMAARKRQSTG